MPSYLKKIPTSNGQNQEYLRIQLLCEKQVLHNDFILLFDLRSMWDKSQYKINNLNQTFKALLVGLFPSKTKSSLLKPHCISQNLHRGRVSVV